MRAQTITAQAGRAMFRHSPGNWARRGALGAFAALVALVALVASLGGARAAEASQGADTVRAWNLHASNALINAPTAPIPGAGQPPQVTQRAPRDRAGGRL